MKVKVTKISNRNPNTIKINPEAMSDPENLTVIREKRNMKDYETIRDNLDRLKIMYYNGYNYHYIKGLIDGLEWVLGDSENIVKKGSLTL